MAPVDGRFVPGKVRVSGVFNVVEVLLGNVPADCRTLLVELDPDGRVKFSARPWFIMANIAHQFEDAPC